MNKLVKINLLVVAILLAVGGVMAYYKTIVSPPRKLEFSNQHVNAVKRDISKVRDANTDLDFDTTFVGVIHELDLMLSNSFLSDQERNELMASFAAQYVPAYVSSCNSKFNKSVWNESELQKIKSRISELQSLQTTDGKIIIQGDANALLNKVHNVIVNYYAAKKVASVSGYEGLESAKQKIATAKRYAAMSPINNCSDLVSKLNSVPSRLERAHYSYLVEQVEHLCSDYNYSRAEHDKLVLTLSVSYKLKEYKNNAGVLYGKVSNISELESRVSSILASSSSSHKSQESSQSGMYSSGNASRSSSKTIYTKEAVVKVGQRIKLNISEGKITRWEIPNSMSSDVFSAGEELVFLNPGEFSIWGYVEDYPKFFKFKVTY